MGFKDQDFHHRFTVMGDPAENACTEWLDSIGRNWVRYGLNRPPISMGMLSPIIRCTPDLLTSHSLIECKGLGQDQLLKLKDEVINALQQWHDMMPVEVFIYDSHHNRHTIMPLQRVVEIVNNHDEVYPDRFPDNHKLYYNIPAHILFDD